MWKACTFERTLLPLRPTGSFLYLLLSRPVLISLFHTLLILLFSLNLFTIYYTVVELYVVSALFWVLETPKWGLPASPQPIPPSPPLLFSPLLFSLPRGMWPSEFWLGWARSYLGSAMDSWFFCFLLASVINYHDGPGLELYVFVMWCQWFKFTSALMVNFLLWSTWPEFIVTTSTIYYSCYQ